MRAAPILPGTGRGTAGRRPVVEGHLHKRNPFRLCPSTSFAGSPPRAGEDFGACAARLAGFAGAVLGWAPDTFWAATPVELASVVRALVGDQAPPPPDAATIARLKEMFPDG